MSVAAIDRSNYDSNSCSNGGDSERLKAFRQATESLPPVLARQQDDASSPNSNPSSSLAVYAMAQPAFYPQLDDTGDSSLSQAHAVHEEMAAVPANGSAGRTASAAPSQPSSPADYLTALKNGTASGDPPDDLTLPPGTTAEDVAQMNGGLLNNLNQLHIQDGTPAGDAAAQKYGYKDMKTLLADDSPQA